MEVVTYDYDIFIKFRDIEIDNTLKERVDKIFDTEYLKSYGHKIIRHVQSHNSKNKNEERFNKRRIARMDKKKEFFSLMNKLTNENYSTVLQKILQINDQEVLDNSVYAIWKFSSMQSIYSDLYLNIFETLLTKISIAQQTEMINKLYALINEFVDIELQNELDTEKSIDPNLHYDEFCDYIKRYKYYKGKVVIICRLIQAKIIKSNFIISVTEEKRYDSRLILDTLHIYHYIIGLNNDIINELIEYKDGPNCTDKKTKFKVLDITQKRPYMFD